MARKTQLMPGGIPGRTYTFSAKTEAEIITGYPVIGKIRDALKDHADIKAWCQAEYGQDHKIYIGYDERKPPPQSDMPVIVICPADEDQSWDINYHSMMIEFGYAVSDSNKTRVSNVVTYVGLQKVLEFCGIVETVLFGLDRQADLDGAWIETAHELVEPVQLFPIYLINVMYTFRGSTRFEKMMP